MSIALARQAIKAYPKHSLADPKTVNNLRRKWMDKISNVLGDKWLLAKSNFITKKF